VPGQEVTRAVDRERVLHVDCDEVVEARFGAGVYGRELRGRFGYALDGGDVGAFFRCADVAPFVVCVSWVGYGMSGRMGFRRTILGVRGACLWYMLLIWQWRRRWLLGLWFGDLLLRLRGRVHGGGTVRPRAHTAP
jgi:hypothetical protein